MQPPPGQSNYYRAPYQPPAEVSLDVLGPAWQMTSQNFGIWVPAIFVLLLIVAALETPVMAFGILTSPARTMHAAPAMTLGTQAILLLYGVLTGLVITPIYTGLMNMAYLMMEGKPVSIGDMFSAFSRYVPVAITGLLVHVSWNIIRLSVNALIPIPFVWLVPGIYLLSVTVFAPLIALKQNVGPLEAISRSIRVLKGGQGFMMSLVYLVSGLVGVLGILACGVGLLFTLAVPFCAIGITYYYFFPPQASNIGPGVGPMPEPGR